MHNLTLMTCQVTTSKKTSKIDYISRGSYAFSLIVTKRLKTNWNKINAFSKNKITGFPKKYLIFRDDKAKTEIIRPLAVTAGHL